jgi:hypothetical protein
VAIVPRSTTVEALGAQGMAPGVLSAGIGDVPSEQTFLDVSQGNRIDDSVYDRDLLGLFPFASEVPAWPEVVARARAAPADLVPGLLASSLASGGIATFAEQPMNAAAVGAANERGMVAPLRPGGCVDGCLEVRDASVGDLSGFSRRLTGDDLLIAIASPPPHPDRALPIGIAGRGFDGNLTSDSTRMNGYVLSTDIAPTILQRFDLPIPDEMDGAPIRSEGNLDVAAVDDLADRMAVIPDRRARVVIVCLAAWIVVALAVHRVIFGLRRVAMGWLALCFAFMPLLLLVGAWLEPGTVAEGLLIGLGAAGLAALIVRFAWGWRGLAIACGVTVGAYAIDVIAGSGLTRLSLLGPNPIFGVRFYGIGNELEALFGVMVPVGVGAWLSASQGSGKPVSERGAVLAFLVTGLLAALVFAAGWFGADVGAAIVLPVGAVVAAWTVLVEASPTFGAIGTTKRQSLVVATIIAAPLLVLALLIFIDLVSGANAHLTRSVINAGGATNLSETVQRRLELSAHDFAQAAGSPLFWVVIVGLVFAVTRWRQIDTWLRPAPLARAGLIGACAAVAVGVLVNDSGATFLVLGSLALGAFLAYAWAQAGEIRSSPRNAPVSDG